MLRKLWCESIQFIRTAQPSSWRKHAVSSLLRLQSESHKFIVCNSTIISLSIQPAKNPSSCRNALDSIHAIEGVHAMYRNLFLMPLHYYYELEFSLLFEDHKLVYIIKRHFQLRLERKICVCYCCNCCCFTHSFNKYHILYADKNSNRMCYLST